MRFPETSMRAYIRGGTALNIPSEEGTGDWHIWGGICAIRETSVGGRDYAATEEVLGVVGFFECAKVGSVPVGVSVYAANHYRAVGNLIVCGVRREFNGNTR